ncbi:MAG: hypothetical protein ACREHF_13310 [Rhizomicrobium sp.]
MTALSPELALPRSQIWTLPSAAGRLAALAEAALVFALYALVTVVVFRSFVLHPGAALIGPPEDNMNDFWNTWYAAVGHNPSHFFTTTLLRFPQGTSLIYQSFAWPQVFAVVALSRIFGTDMHTLVALQNATVLASFPLAGLGAFYLVRHFVHSTVGALTGAFVFAFNPAHVAAVMHHASVSSIGFLPFFALAYLLAIERRSGLWFAAAVLAYALSALSCWYYFFYCAYFMGFELLHRRMCDGGWPRGWPLSAPALCVFCTAVVLSPLVVPMILATHASVYDAGGNIFVADLLAWFAFPPQHLLGAFSHGLYARLTGHPWEATVYLGLANLAALVWVSVRTGVARGSLMFYVLAGMAVFAVLACGETLHVGGFLTGLPLPDMALDRLPFFANVRTPSRAVVFVYLFLSIGTGYAVATALRQRRLGMRAGAVAMALLVAIDFYPATLSATPVACSPGLEVLKADREHGFGVLNVPWGYAEEDAYMLEQVCHRRPIVAGMTTRQMGDSLLFHLSLTDLSSQRRQLVKDHVKYILLHKPRNGMYAWNKQFAPAAQFLKFYRVVYSGPDMAVLRVY